MTGLADAFPSLSKPMSSSRLLGIYFASSWCPDCTPVTPKLRDLFVAAGGESEGKKAIEIVYVSSDNDASQMESSMKETHGPWAFVPFDSDDRSGLKRHFGACAGKEAGELGMAETGKRKFGIPTLVVVDCESGNVITTGGVDDVLMRGTEALAGWECQISS
mmetsp:Transcript_36974/g.110745  ORF Transcript_36974/g.110745 Transcript_36974/m.110745 type:complete len:162 (-) Transcript_36974:601-1086(-)